MTGMILKPSMGLTRILRFYYINISALVTSKRHARQNVPARVAGFVACLFMLPSASFAEAWVFQPSIRLDGIYEDNFRLEPDTPTAGQQGPQQVTTARIAPALRLSRVTDTMDIAGMLRVDSDFFFGDTENLENQSNQLADFSAFKKGELSRWGGILSYRRDTLLRTIGPIEAPTDPSINEEEDVDEGLSRANVRRQRLILGPSWSRYLTERTQIGLSYEFSDVSLSDVPAFNPNDVGTQLTDYYTHRVGTYLLTQVTERDQLPLIFAGRRYIADNEARSNSYQLEAGVVHKFSETTSGTFTLGGIYSTFDRPATVSSPGNGSNSDIAFTLAGTKRTELTNFSGVVQRTTTPSVSGNLVLTTQAIFNVSRLLTERTRFIFRSRIFDTEAVDELDSSSNRRYLSLQPTLRYELSPSWGLETSYQYIHQKRFSDVDSADDNAISISLVYQRPTIVEPEPPVQDIGVGSLGRLGGLGGLSIE
jgi:hypothetical protein